MAGRVSAFVNDLDPAVRGRVRALRALVRRAAPGASETIVWRALSYHRPQVGGRVKGAVCQIVAKGADVRLDFIHGVRLEDPWGLLRGDRLSKRFIPIRTVADARRPELAALVEQAASLDPTQWA
jgi:hypothetical protein